LTNCRKIYVEKDGDACRQRLEQFKAAHPYATNISYQIVKGCEDKSLIVDYDDDDDGNNSIR
jgi:hypothetical protein